MKEAYVREAQLKDAIELAPRLRKIDREEIKACENISALEALVKPFTYKNAKTYSVVENETDKVLGMFGSAPCADPEYGVAWLLSSEDLYKHTKEFVKQSPYWVNEMSKGYIYLYNFVDKRNWKSLKWLQYLGFEPKQELETYGNSKQPFLLMIKEINN